MTLFLRKLRINYKCRAKKPKGFLSFPLVNQVRGSEFFIPLGWEEKMPILPAAKRAQAYFFQWKTAPKMRRDRGFGTYRLYRKRKAVFCWRGQDCSPESARCQEKGQRRRGSSRSRRLPPPSSWRSARTGRSRGGCITTTAAPSSRTGCTPSTSARSSTSARWWPPSSTCPRSRPWRPWRSSFR